jgi:hypothetical protein
MGLNNSGMRVRFPVGTRDFPSSKNVQTDSGSHPVPIKWVPEASFAGVKGPDREGDHSLPSSAEVKNVWSYSSAFSRPYTFMAWWLIKYRDFNLKS